MTEIEKMKRYIERSHVPESVHENYDISSKEYLLLADLSQRCDAVILAFFYGRAKGYRAAKAEARRA